MVLFGTILSNVFLIGNQMSFLIFTFSEVAKDMSSVQRIFEYADYKDHEADWKKPVPPVNWPSQGKLVVKRAVARFRPGLPIILNDLNLEILPK